MTVAATIEATLPELRAEAEALMLEDFEIGDYGDGWTYDKTIGKTVRTFAADFTSIGQLVTSTAPTESQAGERTVVHIDRTLRLPVSSPAVDVGKAARRMSDGAVFTVLADVSSSHPVCRKLAVEQVL